MKNFYSTLGCVGEKRRIKPFSNLVIQIPPLNNLNVSKTDNKLSNVKIAKLLIYNKISSNGHDIMKEFHDKDPFNNLEIDYDVFIQILSKYDININKNILNRLIKKWKCLNDSKINYISFMSANSYYSNCAEKPRCGFAEKDKEINFPEDNTEILESMLRQDLQTNIKEILKDLHRLDYNCDGKINRNDLKQIIDTYHQKLTEDQFNKIYVRHDFHHRGIVDYSEFLQRLGVKFDGKNNFVNPKKLKIKVIGTKNTSVMTSRELDIYFRKKVCSNLNDLIKAFTAGQISDSSLLPIELVYSIFNEFTFKMTLQQFNQIMINLGINASVSICWKKILNLFVKCNKSIDNFDNRLYKNLPNPQRNTNKNTSSFDVLFALKNHINQSFTSLKNAFIHLDENRIGKISRSIIKTFITKKLKIQVPINVMKEIMTALDPQHTNFINYHQFVKFFEQSNKIPEKWLESCHKYNKIISKPLPYDSTLKNLSDVINRKLPNLKKYLKIFNRTIDDYINREIIYRWICQNCFDIERKTFDKIVEIINVNEKNVTNIRMRNFLNFIKVPVESNGYEGISADITNNNLCDQKLVNETKTINNLNMISAAMNRVKIMSSKEIIHGFVDRLKQHFRQFNESFLLYSKSKRGKITKTDFRKILSDCGIYLNSEDFGIVCQFINFNEKGSLNYDQFLKSFANLGDPGVHGPDIKILNSKNHHVNKHREPHDESLFVKDLNVYMNSKLRENFGSLRQAFSKLDFNHVGYLTCLNFKRLFSLCMLNMSNSNLNFEKFCKNLNIDETKKIYYKDFLDLFEIRENLNNGHKWLVSNHRYNLCKDDKLMTAQQVHRLMALKAHQHYKDLACAFCLIDAPVSSTIRRNGLRATLKKFNFNINEEEFETLWRIYDEDNKGELSFPKFISKLVGEQFTPGDLNGTSSRIYLSHFAEINRQKENQSNIHDILSQNNVNNLAKLDIDGIINMIVEKLREYYRNYYTAFKAFDTKKKGYLIKSDIIHGLETMNIFLNELKRKELFEKLKMEDSGLNYKLFMRYFKDGNFDVVKIDKINNEKTYNKSNFSNLKLPYVYLPDNFYEIIFEKFHVLEKAFIAIDVDKKGILPKKSFKQIIKIFCMDLNTKQFKELFERLSMNGTKDTVEYTKFLNYISQGKENVETTKSQSTTKYVLSEDDVHLLDYLKKQIQNNHKDITSTFKCACHSESVDMSTFMKLLSPYLTELCDDKLSHLMNELLVEEFKEDKIDWKKYFDSLVKPIETKDEDSTEFINNNSLHDKTNKIEGINTIQNTQTQKFEGSIKSNNFTCTSMLSKYTARSFTSDASATSDFVNAQNVDNKIEKLVKKNWRKLFKAFKEQDKLLNGHISNENFRDAMLSINSTIPIELINKLISKYDIYSNSKINYREFIKYFVIKKCETIKEEMYDDSFRNRIKMFMKDNWKEIRRRFLVCDSKRSGHITIDQFRFILREMNINLDEMEFIHLLDQYDTNFDGQIAYNKFIANFLKK